MRDFFHGRIAKRLWELVFLIWGVTIMSLYFYYYPAYATSFIWGIEYPIYFTLIFLPLIVFFIGWIVIAEPIFKFLKIKLTLGDLREKFNSFRKIKKIEVPLASFPLFFYFFSYCWIAYIYYRSDNLEIVRNDVITVFILSVLVVLAFSLGAKILRSFKYSFSDWLERFILSCAIGFGTLMLIMYGLGMAHLYYRSVAYGLMGIIGAFCYREIIDLWQYVKRTNLAWNIKPIISFNNFAVISIILILAVYLGGIFQQYPIGFDALISYFTYPEVYVENHSIVNFPFWIYFGFPQNGEMLFTLGFLLFDFQIALGLIYIFTIFLLLNTIYFFRKLEWNGSYMAILMTLSIPVVSFQNISDHKIEIIFYFYVLLSYSLFFIYLRKKDIKTLGLFSFICGITAGIKYFFICWYVLPIFFIFLWYLFKKELKVWHFFIWGSAIFIFMTPWIYKNIKFSGNPLDPVLSEKFANKQFFYNAIGKNSQKYILDEMRNESYLIWDDQDKKDFKFFANLPFTLTFPNNKKYFSDGINIGPLFLCFLPLIITPFLKKRKFSKEYKLILFILFFLLVGWIYIGHLVMWYSVALFGLVSLYVSKIIYESKSRIINIIIFSILIMWTISFISYQYYFRTTQNSLFDCEDNSNLNIINISQFINSIPENEMIWGIDEVRGYYIDKSDKRFIPDNYLLAFSYLLRNHTEEESIKILKSFNVNYLLFRGSYGSENTSQRISWASLPNGSDRYAKLTRENFISSMEFRDKYFTEVYRAGDLSLYRLKEQYN